MQLLKLETEEIKINPATTDPSEVQVQVGGNHGGDIIFVDRERIDNSVSFQVDPLVTTTTLNGKSNKATDHFPQAGVTGDYPSMARNERILTYPMLDPTQSRHMLQILQGPSTSPLVSPSIARATVNLAPLSSASSNLLARRRDAPVAATTKESLGSGNPPVVLTEPVRSRVLPRPETPLSIAEIAPRLGANAAYESDSYPSMIPVRASLALTSTGDLSTASPAQLPMHTYYPQPSSWYLSIPLRLAQLLKPNFFPQPVHWSDYAYRRKRTSLLSCVLSAEGEEDDQGQVLLSSSDEVKDDDDSELAVDLETDAIDGQSLTLPPVLSCLQADDVAFRQTVEELDSNGNALLNVIDSVDGPGSVVSFRDIAQDSVEDNSSNCTPASHSAPEDWPPAEMRNLTVNFLFNIQPASPLTDAFPPLSPQADGFPTAVDDGLEPETATPLDQNLQDLLDFLNTPAQPLSLPLVAQEVENGMTPIEVTMPAHEFECHQSDLTEVEGEEEEEDERGSHSVRPWMKNKIIRADIDLLKFTADYSVAAKVRDEFVETSRRLQGQKLRHLIYKHQVIDRNVRKKEKQDKKGKEEKLKKEEEGRCPGGDCSDLLEDLTVSSLTQSWFDDDSDTVTPGSGIEGSGSSTPVVAAREEMGMDKKEEKDELTAKLDVVFLQLGGFLAPPRLARIERFLQSDVAHEDLCERVPEEARKNSLIVESLGFVVDDKAGDSHESLVLGCDRAYDSDDVEELDAFVDAMEDWSQHPNVTHRLFSSHPHLRDLHSPEISQTINLPGRPSFVLDEQGQTHILAPDAPLPDLSTWTFQPGPHNAPESCFGQSEMSPGKLDGLERHQTETCRTPLLQKWQQFILVSKMMTGREKVWDNVRRRGRRGLYRLSSQMINWMMDVLLRQLQLVQAFVGEDSFDVDADRLVEKEEEVVREVVQGSGYWWPALPTNGGSREGEVESEGKDEEDDEADEAELYRWL